MEIGHFDYSAAQEICYRRNVGKNIYDASRFHTNKKHVLIQPFMVAGVVSLHPPDVILFQKPLQRLPIIWSDCIFNFLSVMNFKSL